MQRRHFLSLAPKTTAWIAAPALVATVLAQDGVSAKTITIGCSGTLSGQLALVGQELKVGVEAAMTSINAKGGINGRNLQFQFVDDGYVPARTAENVKKMISDNSVFALLGCIGTPNNAAILPIVEENAIPYVGPLTGANSLRKPLKNVFHVRASFGDETSRMISKIVGMGIKSIAVVYLDNPFGKEILEDAKLAFAAAGLKAVAEVPLAFDGKNLQAVVDQILAAKPAAVFLGTAGITTVGIVSGLKKVSPNLPIAGLSASLNNAVIQQLGAAGAGYGVSMVFPDPNRAKTEVVRQYQAAMNAVGRKEYSLTTMEAYIGTRVLAEGLQRAGRDLTRPKLQQALASIRNYDLDGFTMNFQTAPYVASKYVELGVLGGNGRFVG